MTVAVMPNVTPEMIKAAEAVTRRPGWSFADLYLAMRLARPLSDGPGV